MDIVASGRKVNIAMVRGDSESLTVSCSVPFAEGDTLYMTVRDTVEGSIQLQKVITVFDSGSAIIPIEPGDTSGMAFGDYVYDIQITRAGGVVTTPVEVSRFRLKEEVTY
ncbi:MAG: hypothetical protein J6Y83_04895 [Bacteroidales bacterium]|nr:hypothetical protein [Bacteroidales bacterium]